MLAWECAACLFLPSEFWQWWERRLQPSEKPEAVVVLYDMQKPSYQKALKLLRCFFFVRGVNLQAVEGETLPEGTKGWGVVQGENILDEEASMNAFLARSTVFGGVLMGVGRFAWRMKWWLFLALASTLRPSMLRARTGLIPGVIAFLLSIYVLIWNLDTGTGMAKGWSDGWRELGWLLRIDQKWGLFAPNPMKEDGWYVIPGKLLNGKVVDLYRNGQPVTWKKPSDIATSFGGQRWRKYYLNLWSKEFASRRLYLARYLCQEWNRKHYGQELVHEVKIYYMLEYTRHYGPETPQKKILWTGTCFKKQKKRPAKR